MSLGERVNLDGTGMCLLRYSMVQCIAVHCGVFRCMSVARKMGTL